jgi:maltose O-acetyltransferase
MGAEVGAQVNFAGELSIDNAIAKPSLSTLHIGENCYIGRQVYFDLPDHIFLAAEVVLSSGVKLLTHQDCGERLLAHYYPRRVAPIRLERGCWIGANAIVLCGVTLGEGCVVGAGAVVTRSFPAYSVLAGVPACVVKTLA